MASRQVLLRVRFAEVSRSAMTELGVSLFSDGNNDKFGRTSTQQFSAPFFDQQKPMLGKSLVFSDYLNLFLFDAKNSLGATGTRAPGQGPVPEPRGTEPDRRGRQGSEFPRRW